MSNEILHTAMVEAAHAGMRLDQIAVDLFPQYSRARLQAWIRSGELKVDGRKLKQTAKLSGGEEIAIRGVQESQQAWLPEAMDLPLIFEDEHILVLDKPAGLVVHPAAGNWSGTLLNGLLAHAEGFSALPRAGIVHRLDKDTSGLMVVAKSLEAQNRLVQQLQARSIKRQYRAIAIGGPDGSGVVNEPIGRHPAVRTKMAVLRAGGKEAVTHYRVRKILGAFRDLELKLETGRTHQIRVHMSWLGFPLVGDPVYGCKGSRLPRMPEAVREPVEAFPRQALHAEVLGLVHPITGEAMEWKTELPEDMRTLLNALEGSVDGD